METAWECLWIPKEEMVGDQFSANWGSQMLMRACVLVTYVIVGGAVIDANEQYCRRGNEAALMSGLSQEA